MTHRQLVFVVLIVLVPTATVLVVARVGAVDTVPAAQRAAAVATSDAGTVGVVSVPFLLAGVLLAVLYRHCVYLYRKWCCARPPDEGRPTSGPARDGDPGASEGLPQSHRGPTRCMEGGHQGAYPVEPAEICRWYLLFGESEL